MTGRNRRLYNEWKRIEQRLKGRDDISYTVERVNSESLPVSYRVVYNILSICGVSNVEHLNEAGVVNEPIFARRFIMDIDIPANYPCIDGAPVFRFLTKDESGNDIAHPWHPNIRYFGSFAGKVCINALNTNVDIAWCIERIAYYLRYELYQAIIEPPYPEDMNVARWVLKQGEPKEWIFFDQE